ncbi:hypothetical protein HYH03_009465 [Edaphochlamys debaryana]|uniref:3-oxo-5-alpha-steroid 4-dehydrogenase C-terminal domain-containing protein n=1 Tax=Edaphochlamys debaryana TaxID=47281 RepID=A0A836BX64_9CHLO|nr:hypothetical protein HYH03_009465 [Edaphochlamys debaryana]|eukprot:KAG2492220.1 hypothetical protein HYH03_009465 [Edaphochlamys debaryana]
MFPTCETIDSEALYWTNVSLLSVTAIIIVASFHSQFKEAAPYGRHSEPSAVAKWGPQVHQRVGHMISDFLPGIPGCLGVYLVYAYRSDFSQAAINWVLLSLWLLHYLYRGLLHPLIMPYSSRTVAVGITVAGLFPNVLFAYLIAAQLACTVYPSDWEKDPRFIIGVILYALGTGINRWADLKLRAGRLALRRRRQQPPQQHGGGVDVSGAAAAVAPISAGGEGSGSAAAAVRQGLLDREDADGSSGADAAATVGGADAAGAAAKGASAAAAGSASASIRDQYFVPSGGLFELVSSPNYLGEMVEWFGYALALWSYPGLAWALFGASTFIPRALVHQRWYRQNFPEYPRSRKALIPFLL